MGLFLLFLKGFALFKRNYSTAVKAEPLFQFFLLPTIKEFEDSAIFSFLPAFTAVHSVAVVYECRIVVK